MKSLLCDFLVGLISFDPIEIHDLCRNMTMAYLQLIQAIAQSKSKEPRLLLILLIITYMHSVQQISIQRSRISINTFDSPVEDTPYKQRHIFLTQRNIQTQMADLQHQNKLSEMQYQANMSRIEQSHNELNKFIEKLDDRVRQVMDRNEAEVLFAYKNHVALVKRQMEQLRRQSQAQASSSGAHLDRIQQLQKQLAIFREQSLILFRKVIEKDKLIEQLRFTLSELQNEKMFMDQTLKGLMKRNKELEVQLNQNKMKEVHSQQNFIEKFDVSMLCRNNFKGKIFKHKTRTALTSTSASKGATTSISKGATINIQSYGSSNTPTKRLNTIKYEEFSQNHSKNFAQLLRSKLVHIEPQLLNGVIQAAQLVYSQMERQKSGRAHTYFREKEVISRATKISMRSRSNRTIEDEGGRPLTASSVFKQRQETYRKHKDFTVKNELSQYFLQCIEAIKKDITRKKNLNSLNFYKQGNPITLSEFKNLDWFKLMQLFLTDERVVEELYKILIEFEKN